MNKRQWLHDAAKIGAGLVVADFITLWWFSMQKALPHTFLGFPIDSSMIVPKMIVDVFLFIMLVHYGWHIGKIPHIKERFYLVASGTVFTVVALAHLIRVVYSGDLVIFGWTAPIFLSWIGVVVATFLAYSSFHLAARMKQR